ncbi:MAG TPA: Wadjet anti-phage system protein JetD domain-containing protein, partial [Microthrixaceae bacterium]|nr:Wadjet anti-phage system protein JetD domain-containing protein [Microthrixaceae bacterium]
MTSRRWTTPGGIAEKLRRRWVDGTLLSALASGAPFPSQDFVIQGPKASEIGADLGAVQQWVTEFERASRKGARFEIVYGEIGGREFGRNRIPTRVRIETYEQAWTILGVEREVARYREILGLVSEVERVHDWVSTKPLKALDATDDWPALLAAYIWLDDARGSGRYLRTIDVPGVDTKFVERHRSVLGVLLDVSGTAPGFVRGLGLASKPEVLRMRFEPGFAGLPESVTSATFRVDEVANLRVGVQSAVVVENETTFLSLEPPSEGVLLWGKGFEADRVGRMRWLSEVPVWYWGDLDTHGFAILNRLRASLPQTTSFLMDRESLLQHRDRWGEEPSPTSASLDRLNADESALYVDLVGDRYGPGVRLEQERLDWGWVMD